MADRADRGGGGSGVTALTVLLPVKNGERWLDAAIASIRAQTFGDFELLAIDDGSTDGTAAIIARHAVEDSRIVPLANPKRGLVSGLNFGMQRAEAPLIARMDADDIALPTRFERQVARMSAEPDLLVLGTGYFRIDEAGRRTGTVVPPLEPAAVAHALERVNAIAHPTVMMRRDAVLAAGGYREAYLRAEDYDLWLRLAERGKLANLPDPLIEYRLGHVPFRAATFSRQVLSEITARTTANLRRSGRPDPTGEWPDINADTLASIGIDRQAVATEMSRRALHVARHSRKQGDEDSFRLALRLADMQPRSGLGERLRYLLRRAKVFL
jgi:glycosyltransferase involved in cell wall biosynthesis